MSEKQVIEINGIKLEVDMRTATKIENYKVGDNVKVLIKEYGNTFKSFPGVIVGFDNFKSLPTLVVCYADISYSCCEIKFICINEKTNDAEIVHMQEHEKLIDKSHAIGLLDKMVLKHEQDLEEIKRKRKYFIDQFEKNFSQTVG